jgi:hypothetical protein
MQPGAGHWAGVNARDGLGVKGELRTVEVDFGRQFLFRKTVGFEIQHPDLLRHNNGQVNDALHQDKLLAAIRLAQFLRRESRRERQLAADAFPLPQQSGSQFGLPERRQRLEIQTRRLGP